MCSYFFEMVLKMLSVTGNGNAGHCMAEITEKQNWKQLVIKLCEGRLKVSIAVFQDNTRNTVQTVTCFIFC